jgi:dipeptidyl aminopeptidase/acylaminoacyl peptidase
VACVSFRRCAASADRWWRTRLAPRNLTSRRAAGFTRKINDINIWQVRAGASAGQPDPPVRLIASTQGDGAPAFSPDGQRITFTSDRSGIMQLWVCNRDGSNATQLTSFSAPGAGVGTWSPDGSQIAFDASVRGNYDIYVVPASGGAFRRLTSDNTAEVSPAWSPDGRWIYFASTRTGRHEIWKMKVQGGSAIQITKHGGQKPMPSPDGEFIYYEKGPTFATEFEPWRVPVNGGEERLVLEKLGSRWWLASNGLYLYEQEQSAESAGPWTLQFFDINSRKKQVVTRLEGMPLLGHRPAVSPDRRIFLYTQLDLHETDLILIENFR